MRPVRVHTHSSCTTWHGQSKVHNRSRTRHTHGIATGSPTRHGSPDSINRSAHVHEEGHGRVSIVAIWTQRTFALLAGVSRASAFGSTARHFHPHGGSYTCRSWPDERTPIQRGTCRVFPERVLSSARIWHPIAPATCHVAW